LNNDVDGTALRYNTQSGGYATSIGSVAQVIGYCGMSIGANCNNTTANYIKFWVWNNSTTSTLAKVQFENIILKSLVLT
jgi:hypothetical protein